MPKVKGSGKSTPLQQLMRLVRRDSPSLVALVDGSPAERRQVLADLKRKLAQGQRTVISFNGRRYLTERDIWVPLVQQLLLVMQDLSSRDERVMASTEQLIANLDGLVNSEERTSRRMEVMREFDATFPALLSDLVAKPPLVMLVQGLDMASRGSLLRLLEFMAGFLDLPGCLFVVSLSLRSLEADLEERHGANLSFTAREFVEDVFPRQVTIPGDEAVREVAREPIREPIRETTREPEKPADAPGPGLATLYALPEQQAKLNAIRNLQPETYTMLEQEPHLLITLERLVRGDTSPELLQQMAASDPLRSSYQDGNLRAILARQPYFDPSPVAPPLMQPGSPGVRSLDEGPRFEPSSGLEVQSGAEIARRRRGAQQTTAHKKVARKKIVKGARKGRKVKGGHRPKGLHRLVKKGVRKAPSPLAGEDRGVTVESLFEPVQSGDFLAARELWTKIPELDQAHLEELIDRYMVATQDHSPRIRATAAAALGSVARAVAWELDSEVTDTMLILTGDAVKEVRDAAAETLSLLGRGVGMPPPAVAAPAAPVFQPAPATPVSQPAPAAPVAPQFQVVPESGGAPQFQAVSAEQKPAPRFKAVGGEESAPQFKPIESDDGDAPQFKPVNATPPESGEASEAATFKPVAAAPQFKPGKASFKVVE